MTILGQVIHLPVPDNDRALLGPLNGLPVMMGMKPSDDNTTARVLLGLLKDGFTLAKPEAMSETALKMEASWNYLAKESGAEANVDASAATKALSSTEKSARRYCSNHLQSRGI